MLGKDAVQRGAGFRFNSLVQVNAAYFGAGVWLINVLRPPPPRSSSRGTEGSNPSRSAGESMLDNRRLLEPIGNLPPAEAEAAYYAQLELTPIAA